MAVLAIFGLFGLTSPAQAQERGAIGGSVLDASTMQPLSGAQVMVQGTNVGTLTNEDGRFLLNGVEGPEVTLRVVRIGYQTETQAATVGSMDVEIRLSQSAIALDEVVVTGTAGGQQRRAIGNSVGTVDVGDLAETAPVSSVQDVINARAPGVVVMPGTGQVGSGSRIRVRGTSTFSLSGDPLIYVDGVRVNNETGSGISVQAFSSGVVSRLNDFDPDQIESIEILKGPAAATLYGTEAARGVINIITKQGTPGETRYSLNIKQGFSQFANAGDRMPTTYWEDPDGEIHSLNVTKRAEDAGNPLFDTGRQQGYSLSMSGGNERLRFFISGDVNDDTGVEPTNYRDSYSGRLNLDMEANDDLDVGLNVGYISSENGLSCEGGCGGTMWTATYATPANLPEHRCESSPGEGCDYWEGYQSGPPSQYHVRDMMQSIDRFTGSVKLDYRPTSWLTNRLTIGTDVTQEHNLEFMPYLANDTLRYFWGATTSNGYRYETRRDQQFNTFDYVGTANVDVTDNVTSSTSVGIQYYQRHIEFLGAQGNEFAGPGLSTIDATARQTYAGSDYLDNNTLGFYMQEVVGLNDRLFLTGAVRVDNNSAFGSDLDFVTYPKASLSWVLSEEPAVADRIPDFLNTFKLRAAYGQSGSQPVAFAALRTFAPVTGPNGTPAVTPSTLGNSELGPERGEEIELGFDATLFEERVGLDFTFYHTRTKDGILLRPIAPSTGYPGSRWVNAGQLRNMGVEALLSAAIMDRENFAWDMNFTLATNDGKVEKLADGDTSIVSGYNEYRVGYAPNAFFAEKVVSAEYDAANDEVINVMCDDGNGGSMPCYNEAGQVVAPRVYLGQTTPAIEVSVQTGFTFFDRLRLSAMLDYKGNYRKTENNLRINCQVFNQCFDTAYPEQADPVFLAQTRTSGALRHSFIQDASFMKLREVSLTYDVPSRFAQMIGGRSARLNLAARNLHTWTDYTGLDPETMFLEGSWLEQSMIPQLRQIVASINVNF